MSFRPFIMITLLFALGMQTSGCIYTTRYTTNTASVTTAEAGIDRLKVLLESAAESKDSNQVAGQPTNISADYDGLSWDVLLMSSASMMLGGGLVGAVADTSVTSAGKERPYLGNDRVNVRYADMQVAKVRLKKNTYWDRKWEARVTLPTTAHTRDGQKVTRPLNLYFKSMDNAQEFLDLIVFLQREGVRAKAST